METVKNILVALDLSAMDKTLLRYASFLAEKLNVRKIYFVHNIKIYEISDLFEDEFHDIDLEELIGEEIQEKVEAHFEADTPYEVLISEDPNSESLINYVVNKYDIELTLIGNKPSDEGSGILSAKLLRILRSNILSIPKNVPLQLDKVWVGTDFSGNSKKSFSYLSNWKNLCGFKLIALHVYHVPAQFAIYLPREELAPKIKRHAEQKAEKFWKKAIPHSCDQMEVVYAKNQSISEKLLSSLNNKQPDLFVLSDKGANNYSSLLVGSLTDELFGEDLPMPYLVVK